MRSLLIVIGALLVLGGISKGIIYYSACERLPGVVYQAWASTEHHMQGMTSRVMSPLSDAAGQLGMPTPPAPTLPEGPSPETRAQFEAIVNEVALLFLLEYALLGIAAGSVLFGLAHVIGLLERRPVGPGVPLPLQPGARKF